jgi:hypothetical protein
MIINGILRFRPNGGDELKLVGLEHEVLKGEGADMLFLRFLSDS